MTKKRIVIAGGTGFLGTALASELVERHYEVVILTRFPSDRDDGVFEEEWDGEHIGEWIKHLDGAEAVVNLAGKNINCPHTPENLRYLTSSRVNSVRAVAAAVYHVPKPPRVWVQASAVGYYGDRGDEWCNENSLSGSDDLSEVCREWEMAFNSADTVKTQRTLLRIGTVLDWKGGALPVLGKLTKWFLGGQAGDGKQYVSWIHLADLLRIFLHAVEPDNFLSGTYNAVAPNPVTNAELMSELRRALNRPWSPPVPKFAVKLGARLMDSEASLALISQRCAPKRFLENGFEFQFPTVRRALENLCWH